MVAVAPAPAVLHCTIRPVRRSTRSVRVTARWFRRIAGRLPGQYTIAKVDAYNQFREQATRSTLAKALVLSPVPCLISNVVIESIPLADPALGFEGSLHFQIRHFVAGMMVAIMPVLVKFTCIPDLPTRSWKFTLGYGVALAGAGIGCNAVISVLAGVFPVPFGQFAPSIPLAIVGGTLNRLFLETPATKERGEKIDQWAAMDALPIFVYPIFTAVFMTLKPDHQLWFSLLLPVLKQLLREVVWLVFKDDLDLVGATTCTIVHFYHILFTAMCLQNAKSLETLTAVIFVNSLQMMLNCREILKDADALDRSRKQLAAFGVMIKVDAVSAGLKLAEDKHVARYLHHKAPSRIFSKYQGYQGVDFTTRYEDLLEANAAVTSDPAITHEHDSCHGYRRRRTLFHSAKRQTEPARTSSIRRSFARIIPFSGSPAASTRVEALPSSRGRLHGFPNPELVTRTRMDAKGNRKETFIRCVTSALHQTETILLRSYITINALLFYGVYLLTVYQLPNRKYFATMTTLATPAAVQSMVRHLLLLGGLEVVFFAVYLVLISRRLGVSGVHQLAFVLWSQRVLLQAKFLTLTLMILGFPLEHYGNGLIFRLRSDQSSSIRN